MVRPDEVDGKPNGWTLYELNSYVPLDSAGTLLVRVEISPEHEELPDGPETFNLVATNTGGTSGAALGTILDDGLGSYWIGDATAEATEEELIAAEVKLDDDRPLTVGNIKVNEGSSVAVFTVTGAPNQVALLELANASGHDGTGGPDSDQPGAAAALGTTLPTLQYLDTDDQWVNYDEKFPHSWTKAASCWFV